MVEDYFNSANSDTCVFTVHPQTALMELISRDSFCAEETEIFFAVQAWAEHYRNLTFGGGGTPLSPSGPPGVGSSGGGGGTGQREAFTTVLDGVMATVRRSV